MLQLPMMARLPLLLLASKTCLEMGKKSEERIRASRRETMVKMSLKKSSRITLPMSLLLSCDGGSVRCRRCDLVREDRADSLARGIGSWN